MDQSFQAYSKSREREEVLWKDRKRYMGMPLSFTRYQLTKTKLTVKKGLFNTSHDDILLYRILDIELHRSFGQKIFGVGTITIHAQDRSTPELILKNIKKSEAFADYLGNIVEKVRDSKRVTGREMYGAGIGYAGSVPGDMDGDGIPDHLQVDDQAVDIDMDQPTDFYP